MSVRVRFAPSPTGYLHIGGARTALYCYLIARATGGSFILRIEDTDLERSKKEYEEALIEDLKWVGLDYDEGPGKEGDFAPYRQSQRLELYRSLAQQLVDEGKAYPCFLSGAELDELTEKAKSENKAPHAYHGQYRNIDSEEVKRRLQTGEEHVIRFKNPGIKYTFTDLVRGEVTFPEDMVGDFVIMRSNGMPVYNFCCAIDDWKMAMTHVIRAEEHLNNTVRQLMIYEAFGVAIPQFAHCSLLVGEDRQKLSKRHAATSVVQYKEQGYLPQALANYLCLLGWSHPQEKDIFDLDEIVSLFDLQRFNKSPALYDMDKLKFFNGQHMRKLSLAALLSYGQEFIPKDHAFHSCEESWKQRCLSALVEKISLPSEFPEHLAVLFETPSEWGEEVKDINSWETTSLIREYVRGELEKLRTKGCVYPTEEDFSGWVNHVKKELKIKGKPLFKGMRAVLTGRAEGADLKVIIPLTKVETLLARFW